MPGDEGMPPAASTAAAPSTSESHGSGATPAGARIIHLVEQAQSKRAPVQSFVERFAAVTPAVLNALALVVAVVPSSAARCGVVAVDAPARWFCWSSPARALWLSPPLVSVVAALAGAVRKGVLINRGGRISNEPAGCAASPSTKTGTLTCGTPESRRRGHRERHVG